MKKLLYLGFIGLLLVGCQKEESPDSGNNSVVANSTANLVEICHYDSENDEYSVIAINENAVEGHVGHGDIYDMDGDGYYPENPCGLDGGLGEYDCDDNDATINPGEGNCGCSDCPYADLDLYAPYISLAYFPDFLGLGQPGIILHRPNGETVQIFYSFNIYGEWEFLAFPEVLGTPPCNKDLPCGAVGGCEYFFSISEEEALCLIQEALTMFPQSSPENQNKSDFKPIRISDLKK